MAGNQNPIYSRVGSLGFANTTANNTLGYLITGIQTDYAGTVGAGSNNAIVFTADTTNGGYVQRIRFKASGTTGTAAVARIYIGNAGTISANANVSFYGELSLPSITSSTTAAQADIDYPMNFALPPGYRVIVGISSSAVLTAGWTPTVVAGAY